MSILQKIRNLFGLNTEIQNSPIEALDKLVGEEKELNVELKKAQDEFDEHSNNLELKILACEKLIEKGEKENSEFNKGVLENKLNKITEDYIQQVSIIYKSIESKKEEKINLESDILQKSIEITTHLSSEEQKEVSDLIKTWEITGIVKGEECPTQLHAIVASIDEVLKANVEEVVERTKVLTIPEEPENLAGHYSNVIVKNDEGKVLFLKRANDKVIAPGQYCLPGGHIDEGETIEKAGLRELQEEAGLIAKYAYIAGKAKCENGKWAFYLYANPESYDVMLLDGESVNCAWMNEDEWMEADLIFDLKDHMRALEARQETKVKDIPEIKKAEEALLEGESDILIKGRAASTGEKRTWGGIEYVKTDSGKWIKTKGDKKKDKDEEFKHTTDQLVSHAENTSSDQLKKIIADEKKPHHVRDSAKRELERRNADKEENKVKSDKPKVKKKSSKVNIKKGTLDFFSEKSESHKAIRAAEKDIISYTEQKFESCALVKDGKRIYSQDGDKSSINFNDVPLSVRDNWKGGIFTHNHPSSRSFSLADLRLSMSHGVSEMRAIAPNSIKGPVTWVFKNEMPSDNSTIEAFTSLYRKIDGEVKKDFQSKIDSSDDSKLNEIIEECNQSHAFEVLSRLKKLTSSDPDKENLNKWDFYWEKYEK